MDASSPGQRWPPYLTNASRYTPYRIPDVGYRTLAAGSRPPGLRDLDRIQDAHAVMEGNEAAGNLVVRVAHPSA
ncbi:hypothetical protein OH781_40565 [Streptomyces sp. NBC_01550]|uniref:hypothetical protein n=1 Tax=unclassified Streptomyces TaxID=2593676 RepID=UPI0036E67C13